LIALIAKTRLRAPDDGGRATEDREAQAHLLPPLVVQLPVSWRKEKTSFASNASGSSSGQASSPRLVA